MACPACGCKETYQYNDGEDFDLGDELIRCAACGAIFEFEDETDEDENVYPPVHSTSKHDPSEKCWCEPEKVFVDPETGNDVYVHREIQ